MSLLKSFLRDEQGQDLVEYSLLLAFIGLGTVGVLTTVKGGIQGLWGTINTKLTSAKNTANAGQ